MFQNPHLKSRFFVIYQWDIAHKPPKFDGLCIITRAEILRNVTFLHFCKTPVVKAENNLEIFAKSVLHNFEKVKKATFLKAKMVEKWIPTCQQMLTFWSIFYLRALKLSLLIPEIKIKSFPLIAEDI